MAGTGRPSPITAPGRDSASADEASSTAPSAPSTSALSPSGPAPRFSSRTMAGGPGAAASLGPVLTSADARSRETATDVLDASERFVSSAVSTPPLVVVGAEGAPDRGRGRPLLHRLRRRHRLPEPRARPGGVVDAIHAQVDECFMVCSPGGATRRSSRSAASRPGRTRCRSWSAIWRSPPRPVFAPRRRAGHGHVRALRRRVRVRDEPPRAAARRARRHPGPARGLLPLASARAVPEPRRTRRRPHGGGRRRALRVRARPARARRAAMAEADEPAP